MDLIHATSFAFGKIVECITEPTDCSEKQKIKDVIEALTTLNSSVPDVTNRISLQEA